MKKLSILLSITVILAIESNAAWLGADAKVGSIKLNVGQVTFSEKTTPLFLIDIGGNHYWNNGLLIGASFGLGYAKNPTQSIDNKSMLEMNGNFRVGYSLAEIGKGFELFGIVDFTYLTYSRQNITNSQLGEKTTFSQGIGFGGGIEYVFDSPWILTATYTTTKMTPDSGADFDYNKALFSVGYTF